MATSPSCRTQFEAAEGGKTTVSMARRINTRGENGPWPKITTVAAQGVTLARNLDDGPSRVGRTELVAMRPTTADSLAVGLPSFTNHERAT